MCYVIGIRVPKKQTIKVGNTDIEIDAIDIPVQSGFEYKNWPVIYKDENYLRPGMMHWELIPSWTRNQKELLESRKKYTTLNIKAEGILTNKVAQAVVHTNRCLVLASHFFEWQELEKQKFPHCIQIKNSPLIYIAGVWNTWTDYSNGEMINSFGIITTAANSLMSKIHNVKKRMPSILDASLANAWVNENLNEKLIQEIASFQFPAETMNAYTVAKNFQQVIDPTAPFNYEKYSTQSLF